MAIDYASLKFPKGPSRYERKDARKKAEAQALRAAYAAVDTRDGRACRLCGRKTNPEATGLLDRGHRHHLAYRSKGGQDTTDNLITLCAACHHGVHSGRVRLTGNADEAKGVMLEVATDAGWKVDRFI